MQAYVSITVSAIAFLFVINFYSSYLVKKNDRRCIGILRAEPVSNSFSSNRSLLWFAVASYWGGIMFG